MLRSLYTRISRNERVLHLIEKKLSVSILMEIKVCDEINHNAYTLYVHSFFFLLLFYNVCPKLQTSENKKKLLVQFIIFQLT